MADLTTLQTIWFAVIVIAWTAYFVLEAFDFGVGMLLGRIWHHPSERRLALRAIGPTWTANEVWLIIGLAVMFGAFPGWYAAWTSGLYLLLFTAVIAIVVRGAGIELLHKRPSGAWTQRWERATVIASTVAPFAWGIAWTATLDGFVRAGGTVSGDGLGVINAYTLLGGLVFVVLARAQGAAYLVLRTSDRVALRARGLLRRSGLAAAPVVLGFVAWTLARQAGVGAVAVVLLVLVALAVGALAVSAAVRVRPGLAFGAGCAAVALLIVALFAAVFPAGIGGAGDAPGLALASAGASGYTLTLMTIIAVPLLPFVLVAQAFAYITFRHRLTRSDVEPPRPDPIDLVARAAGAATRHSHPPAS